MKLKKAAMFGLCRALKKQSGGLFLASRHSADSQETRGSFKATRAAMFGLDARIALAIFGALSVISGAALYSAISKAKSISYNVNFKEITKAAEHYYLDTGQMVQQYHGNYTSPADLVTNLAGVSNWNGPYIAGYSASGNYLDTSVFGSTELSVRFALLKKRDWLVSEMWPVCKDNNIDCAEWIRICYSSGDELALIRDIFSKVEDEEDSNDGALTGNVRYINNSGTECLYYKNLNRVDRV